MRPKAFIFLIVSVAILTSASWFGADWAVRMLEKDTKAKVDASLNAAGQTWASIETDGLIVGLNGEAPSETARFRALEVTARIVDTNRIDDQTTIVASGNSQIPDFTVEILRNGEELSLIGLVPGKKARIGILQQIETFRNDGQFTDLMESLEFEPPEGWTEALGYAVTVSERLPKSRVVVRPGGVSVEAFFDDARSARETRESLNLEKPEGIDLSLDFSAPKSIVAPFRFVATINEGQLNVTECWSDTQAAKGAIYTALSDLETEADCPEALGAPSPEWSGAVVASIEALGIVQNATLTITDADVLLEGIEQSNLEMFDAAAQNLRDALPEFFSLKVQTPGFTAAPEPRALSAPTFTANLTEDGKLSINGPMRDTMSREATIGFAAAQFPNKTVTTNLSVAANVPPGWSPRVLAALDALSLLNDGSVEMTMDSLTLAGRSAQEDAPKFITAALKDRIDTDSMILDVLHEPRLANVVSQADVDAQECERQLAGILREAQIVFDPNSSTISEESEILVDEIAFIVSSCPNATFEIGGHTDSQGREEMNLALSQSRADAVMDALLSRDVLLDQLSAQGFGESEPIADNETENGRARNRRIAFKLINTIEEPDEQN